MTDDNPDRTGELCGLLGLSRDEVLEAVGGWWQRADPTGQDEDRPRAWFAAGYPPEVLLGVGRGGEAAIAVPAIEWHGHEPVLRAHDVRVAPDALVGGRLLGWLRTEAADVTRRRRAAIFSCRYCRARTGPERRHQGQVCMGCAERYLGVVH